jgi:hypothetical protein
VPFPLVSGGSVEADTRPSLYDRLGGVYNIATVIDDFIDRIMHDDRLNKNPAVNEAPSGFSGRVQVSRDRNGVLGSQRSPAVHRPADG